MTWFLGVLLTVALLVLRRRRAAPRQAAKRPEGRVLLLPMDSEREGRQGPGYRFRGSQGRM